MDLNTYVACTMVDGVASGSEHICSMYYGGWCS